MTMEFWSEDEVPLIEFVEYHIYPLPSETMSLQNLILEIKEAYKELCSDYFWHRQEPLFELIEHPTQPYIHGKFETGDSVDDEWTMVYILIQLTKIFPIVATIHDVDGEFLLIEAADVLPKWLDRVDASKNRIFIEEGKVAIIPKDIKVNSLQDALNNIKAAKDYPAIQRIVEKRAIEAYQQPKHNARVSIPERVWRIIHDDPSLTSKSVDMLYRQDSELQFKAQSANIFPPKDILQTTIKFSRNAFVQLICQPFEPLPVSEWSKILNKTTSEELGMKLTCGLEMLCINSNISIPDKAVPPNEASEDSLQWMELDESTFEEDYLKPNDIDKIAKRFEHSMKTIDSDDSTTDTSHDSFLMENLSDLETTSSSDDSGTESDTFLEKEILETIKNDPDLLMKIIEKSSLNSTSPEYAELFEKLRCTESTNKQGNMKQKGMADLSEFARHEIEDYKRKAEENRRKRTEPTNEDDVVNESTPQDSSSEEETELYSPNFKELCTKYKNMEIPFSDDEKDA